jgi:tRNA-specific 2-thiouridylase
VLRWHEPQRRVAPGQTVVLYDIADALVLAGGIATRPT